MSFRKSDRADDRQGQKTITDCDYAIGTLLCVIEGVIQPGSSDHTAVGRHSQCFVYVLSGNTDYVFGEKTLSVQPGDVLYLAKGALYQMKIHVPYQVIYVDFELSGAGPEADALSSALYRGVSGAEALFRRLLSLWLHGGELPAARTRCRETLYGIYASLMEHEEQDDEKRRLIAPAVKLISEHLSELPEEPGVSVGRLAAACGFSEAQFRRLFHRCFGMAPNRYISRLKLRRAEEMLRYGDTGMNITSVAEMLGYSSIYYFSKRFKAEYGMTPSKYRQLFRRQ